MNTQKQIKEKTLEMLEVMIDNIKKDIFIVEEYYVSNDWMQQEIDSRIVNMLTGHSEATIKYQITK